MQPMAIMHEDPCEGLKIARGVMIGQIFALIFNHV